MPQSIRPGRILAGLATAALLFGTLGYFLWPEKVAEVPPRPKRPAQVKFSATGLSHPTEQRWMAMQVGRQIAETIAFAKGGPEKGRDGFSFITTDPSASEKLEFLALIRGAARVQGGYAVGSYFWAPTNYADWAHQVLAAWKPPVAPAAPADGEIFERLATPRADMLAREDLRLSAALTKAPLDPQLHEEAALLVGSFILREAAGDFSDTRREMCALSVHLALARAIRPETSSAGELAEAILCILSGRETDGSEILTRLRLTARKPRWYDHDPRPRLGAGLENAEHG